MDEGYTEHKHPVLNWWHPPRYIWDPQKDITTYELALCVPAWGYTAESAYRYIDTLPECAKRHFKKREERE